LEEFKTKMLSSFASQIDALQVQKKQAEAEAALAIFCSKCREKHPLRECPLDKVPVCTICEKYHETQQCPSLPGIKAALQSTEEEAEVVYLMTQRRKWPQRQGMNSNTAFSRWNNHSPFQTNYPPMNKMQYPPFNPMHFLPMQQPIPPFADPTMWNPWAPQQSYCNQWNPNWVAQQIPFPQHQQSLSLPSNTPPNN